MERKSIAAWVLIWKAEKDLGPLTDGQRRDLLSDQRPAWDRHVIEYLVAYLRINPPTLEASLLTQ